MMFPPEEQATPRLRGFEVLERLGAGGLGSVYLARSKAGRLVAIKMLGDPRKELDAEQKQALAREASLSARLVHPNIVQVRAFVQDAGYAALVFEYVQGVALARLLRFAATLPARLPDRAAFTLLERVLAALSHAHAHRDESGLLVPIVHRDVSPANVLLDWEGNVKLTDFGMAKMMGTSTGTRVGMIEGTLGCMSPEQARGESVTERADVYAAALLAWRLATGLSPFAKYRNDEVELLRAMRSPRIASLTSLRPDLPPAVLDGIQRALAADPDERTITASELGETIAGAFDLGRGEIELRSLLKASRRRLEAMSTLGGVEQTYSALDPSAGHTMRYEEVALAYDRDPHPDGAPSSDRAASMKALEPMRVDVSHEMPTRPVIPLTPMRQSLPSLDELTVLSEIGAPSGLGPDLAARARGGAVKPAPQPSERARPGVRRARAPRPWFIPVVAAIVAMMGVGVGVVLAWLFLRH